MSVPEMKTWNGAPISVEDRDEWIERGIGHIRKDPQSEVSTQSSGDSLIVVTAYQSSENIAVYDCVVRRASLWNTRESLGIAPVVAPAPPGAGSIFLVERKDQEGGGECGRPVAWRATEAAAHDLRKELEDGAVRYTSTSGRRYPIFTVRQVDAEPASWNRE